MTNSCAGSRGVRGPGPGFHARLLALDIDDTLTGADGRISRRNIEAIEHAREQGIVVTLVTGRRYRGSAERAANDLGISGPIACHYGRALVEHPGGEFAALHLLDRAVCSRVLELAGERGLLPSLCSDEVFYWTPEVWRGAGGRTYPLTEVVEDLGAVLDRQGDRIVSMAVSGHGAGEARRLLQAEFGGRVHVYSQPIAGDDRSIEVILSGAADKGTALVDVCRLLEIDPLQSLAVGDSEADIPLLRAAGCGVAMPWSSEQVRVAADVVAEGSPEEAAAAVIERLLEGGG